MDDRPSRDLAIIIGAIVALAFPALVQAAWLVGLAIIAITHRAVDQLTDLEREVLR
jgi:hypothetical protein